MGDNTTDFFHISPTHRALFLFPTFGLSWSIVFQMESQGKKVNVITVGEIVFIHVETWSLFTL